MEGGNSEPSGTITYGSFYIKFFLSLQNHRIYKTGEDRNNGKCNGKSRWENSFSVNRTLGIR